jgi:hypothetical protein
MRRFLNNLFRDFRTISTPRGSRRAPRRTALQLEGLEDRLVPSERADRADRRAAGAGRPPALTARRLLIRGRWAAEG